MHALTRKVAHLTSVHVPSDTRITYRECAALVAVGYDVVLIAAGSQPELPRGVRFIGVTPPSNRFQRMTKTVWQIYRAAVRERADVYHFHDPELMLVGLALRARGARVVFDVHEDIPRDVADKPWIPRLMRSPVAALSALLLRAFPRCYSAIVTATPAIARRFTHAHTIVVSNYPNVEELDVENPPPFEARANAVIYLGEITELRCIQEMVRALEVAGPQSGVRLQLAGRFENAELERRVRALPGWQYVDYFGYAPRTQVPRLLSNARAGMLLFRPAANHDEAMPTKLFEYLGAGLPVIVSNTFLSSSIVAENACGFVVDPFDIESIARAMIAIVTQPDSAREMGARGRNLVIAQYQWNSEANKLTALYQQIV